MDTVRCIDGVMEPCKSFLLLLLFSQLHRKIIIHEGYGTLTSRNGARKEKNEKLSLGE